MIEWMAQTDPLREAITVKKMNYQLLLLSLNKIAHYYKKWTTANGALKAIYCLYKNMMLQIYSLNSSCSQKQQYPKRTLRLKVLQKRSSLEKVAVLKVTLAIALLKYLLYFINNINYCCEIAKLTESNWSESHPCKWKCLQLLF